eukprot:jgi/Ulvmu1/68/UM001_0071.1
MGSRAAPDLTRVALQQAQKSAEALFESKSVADIKKVESQTRHDIDKKKLQLRQMVGESYTELITSANMIQTMADNCKSVADDLSQIRGVFGDLARDLTSNHAAATTQKRGMTTSQLELYAIGSRVKFLVDTPEALWGQLDSKQPLVAARRFRAAALVHGALTKACPDVLRRQFPLLRNQWAAVDGKRADILASADAMLRESSTLPQMATSVAAVCLINGCSSAAALTHFLNQRTRALAMFASQPPVPSEAASPRGGKTPDANGGAGHDSASLTSHACAMAAMVQDALFHAILLFMDGDPLGVAAGASIGAVGHTGHKSGTLGTGKLLAWGDWHDIGGGEEGGPMIMRALVADSHASAELLFDALPGAADGDSEAEAWDAALKQQRESMPPLAAEDVRLTCTAWLHDLPAAAPGLFAAAGSCRELAAVSDAVRSALGSWAPRGGGAAAAAANGAEAVPKWPAVASLVLGRGVDVWGAVFEPCALRRAGTIVNAAVRRGAAAAQQHLGKCRAAAAAAAAADAPGGCSAAAEWSCGTGPAPWRAALPEARAQLDTAVTATLSDAVSMLARRNSGVSRMHAEAKRAEALERHVHTAVAEGVQHLADELRTLQQALPQESSSRVVEEALLIGRAAHQVAHASAALPLALAPLSAWPSAAPSTASSALSAPLVVRAPRGAAAAASAARLRPLQDALGAVSQAAFDQWATWAAAGLAASFIAAIPKEPVLRAEAKPRMWRRCVMESLSDATAAELGEVAFQLPAEPLPPTMALLSGAVRELQRAGGPTLPPPARDSLAAALQVEVVKAFEAEMLTKPAVSAALSEIGVLQLVFDSQLIAKALVVPRPGPAAAGAGAAAPSAAAHAAQRLHAALIERLDPVDWAAYQGHVASLTQQSLLRKGLLLGLLVRTDSNGGMGEAASAAAKDGADNSFLDAAPTAPRLPLLPISMPHVEAAAVAAHASTAAAGGAASTGPGATPAAAAPTAPARLAAMVSGATPAPARAADLCAALSFGELPLGKPLAALADGADAVGRAADGDGSVAGAAMATFESLGARISGSAGSAFSGGIGLNVSAVQEQLGSFGGLSSVLQPGGVFPSSFFGSAFGSSNK